MHSSRMGTARSSSHHGGVGLGVGQDSIPLNFPLGCGPGPDPPQLPPWVWAWTRSPSTSPLGVGLETCKACWDQAPPRTRHPPRDQAHPCGQTHTCKHITLPQTSFAGRNNKFLPHTQGLVPPSGKSWIRHCLVPQCISPRQ